MCIRDRNITVYHKRIFDFYLEQYPDHFLEFFRFSVELTSERILSFNGVKYLQKFINTHWQTQGKKIGLFLLDIEERSILNSKIKLTIPDEFSASILTSLKGSNDESSEGLFEIYWKLIILRNTKTDTSQVLLPLAVKLFSSTSNLNDFTKDILGSLLETISGGEEDLHCICLLYTSRCV